MLKRLVATLLISALVNDYVYNIIIMNWASKRHEFFCLYKVSGKTNHAFF